VTITPLGPTLTRLYRRSPRFRRPPSRYVLISWPEFKLTLVRPRRPHEACARTKTVSYADTPKQCPLAVRRPRRGHENGQGVARRNDRRRKLFGTNPRHGPALASPAGHAFHRAPRPSATRLRSNRIYDIGNWIWDGNLVLQPRPEGAALKIAMAACRALPAAGLHCESNPPERNGKTAGPRLPSAVYCSSSAPTRRSGGTLTVFHG